MKAITVLMFLVKEYFLNVNIIHFSKVFSNQDH